MSQQNHSFKYKCYINGEMKRIQKISILDLVDVVMGRADFPVLQFTGATDGNGRDIYDGDIIASSYWRESNDSKGGIYLVKRTGTSWHPFHVVLDYRDHYQVKDALWDYTIIGNRFQNPELVEKAHLTQEV